MVHSVSFLFYLLLLPFFNCLFIVNMLHRLRVSCDLEVRAVQHELERAEVKIVFTCDDCLPLVAGNIGELEQVFLNLIINAQHAMPEGGTLAVSARVVDEAVLMEFADTGIGIPDALLDNIFEPFFSTRSEQGGTGLGLSVSYGIVERHGGSIEVHSEYGEGTRFSLRFPVAEGAFDA